MKYTKFVLLLSILMAVCVSTIAFAQSQPSVQVSPVSASASASQVLVLIDGKLVEATSVEMAPRGQQVLVWLRDLEKIGWGSIQPGPAPGQTTLKGKTVSLTFTKGQSLAMVNSLAVQLPINCDLRGGKLMVPLAFVAKSLGYSYDFSVKPVVTISTTPPPVPAMTNSIRGQVLYSNSGARGIKVSLVDPEYRPVKGAVSVTDADGNYFFTAVPDGEYMAYVWVGDNPSYFNRVSEKTTITGGKSVILQPIQLGRIIAPIRPQANEVIILKKGRISFVWTQCEGAAIYHLTVSPHGSTDPVLTVNTSKPSAEIVTKKLIAGEEYDVDVQAENEAGAFLGGTIGSGGKPWTFTVKKVL